MKMGEHYQIKLERVIKTYSSKAGQTVNKNEVLLSLRIA